MSTDPRSPRPAPKGLRPALRSVEDLLRLILRSGLMDRAQLQETLRGLTAEQRARAEASGRRAAAPGRLDASTGLAAVSVERGGAETREAERALDASLRRVRELTASLNELLGWPKETPLELAPPAPLGERLSLEQAVSTALRANTEVIEAEQTEGKSTVRNDRLVAVSLEARDFDHVKSVRDLNANLLAELEHFFVAYNETRGKRFQILATRGPRAAQAILKRSRAKAISPQKSERGGRK